MVETLTVTLPETAKKVRKARKAKAEAEAPAKAGLKLPQVRVLRALVPAANGDKPFLDRAKLGKKAGFSEGSGTLQVALAGRNGKPGLVELEMIKRVDLIIEGVKESGYQITAKGIKAVDKFLAEHDGKVKRVRDASLCTNNRFTRKAKKAKAS